MTESEFILEKHANGATIVQTIKAVAIEFGLSLTDAKFLVSAHPIWANVVSATEPLIDEVYRMQTSQRPDGKQD